MLLMAAMMIIAVLVLLRCWYEHRISRYHHRRRTRWL